MPRIKIRRKVNSKLRELFERNGCGELVDLEGKELEEKIVDVIYSNMKLEGEQVTREEIRDLFQWHKQFLLGLKRFAWVYWNLYFLGFLAGVGDQVRSVRLPAVRPPSFLRSKSSNS